MQSGRAAWRDLVPALAPSVMVTVAVLLRVLWVLLVPTKPVGDFAMYLESAVHLQEHGALDRAFVYMPGYVALAAAIFSLGGGLLAVKLVGAVLAGAAAGAVYGIGAALADRRTGLIAGWGYALWPAGIAVTSVTGTDMPSAALLALCVWALVKLTDRGRPWAAAIAFGALMGLCAYLRAVAVPLAGFDIFYFRARGDSWRRAAGRAGVSAVVAFAVLVPWGLRNQARYGEWFITDSHGGLTALVGANPNSEGRYSRSLNLMFRKVTGYTLLAEPHREADRASYVLAKQLTTFSPAYAAGLVVEKARRLLAHERPLLYWPIYRAGVLRPGPVAAFFDRHRPNLERVVDGYWLLLVGGAFAGLGLAAGARRWLLLAFVPMMLALVGMYALYFAEVRYQLPIATLMFPLAGFALSRLSQALRRRWRPDRREMVGLSLALTLLVGGWPTLLWAGERLRERHRFAAHVCEVAGVHQLCLWRSVTPGDSPVRGVHDGVGLTVAGVAAASSRAVATLTALPPGNLELTAQVDVVPGLMLESWATPGEAQLLAAGQVIARAPLAALAAAGASGPPLTWRATLAHPGGPLLLELRADTVPALGGAGGPRSTLWLSSLAVRARR